jgi:hypothetical protein
MNGAAPEMRGADLGPIPPAQTRGKNAWGFMQLVGPFFRSQIFSRLSGFR